MPSTRPAENRIAAMQDIQERVVNRLSSIQPGRSWYLPADVVGLPVNVLVDPRAVVLAISQELFRDLTKFGDQPLQADTAYQT